MFLAPEIFGGRPNEILDQHYKIGPSTDHHAKFHTGRPTHFWDLALGKKTSGLKLKSAPQAIASGRTNKTPLLHNNRKTWLAGPNRITAVLLSLLCQLTILSACFCVCVVCMSAYFGHIARFKVNKQILSKRMSDN